MIRKLVLLCAALAVCAAMQPPAQAQTTLQPGDPHYDDLVTVVQIAEPDVIVSYDAAGDCHRQSRGYHIEIKNPVGVVLVKVGSSLTTCTRNGKVVHKDWGAPWCWTSAVTLWNCKEITIEDQSSQDVPRAYIWRQWRFHLHYCLAWYCKDAHPWIYIGGRGDGSFGTNGGMG